MTAVAEILAWWAARMAELVPAWLRGGDLPARVIMADVQPGSGEVNLAQRRGHTETRLHGPPPRTARPRRTLLRLPAGAVLERPLVLPIAAEPELARVVAYELDRISPFAAAEVAHAYHLESRDRAAGRLNVRVALLPRLAVTPAIEALRAMGLAPDAAIAPRANGGLWRIPLAAPDAAARRGWQRAALPLAATACALLAVAAGVTPFVTQQIALDRTEAAISGLRPATEEVTRLRRSIAGRDSGTDAVAAETAVVGEMLTHLGTLAGLLPDDTYLTALAIRRRVLTMSGRSVSAARLIPLLASDPALRNAAFAAPVTRAEGSRGDVFSIRAELRP